MVVSHEDVSSAKKVLHHVRTLRPDLPVMVRTRDERPVEELRAAGATEVVPETLEAGLMIAVHALVLLEVPLARVVRRMQELREGRYHLLRELFRGESAPIEEAEEGSADELRPVELLPESPAIGRALDELGLEGVAITAMVRGGQRRLTPPGDTRLEPGDVVVMFGAADDLERAERALVG